LWRLTLNEEKKGKIEKNNNTGKGRKRRSMLSSCRAIPIQPCVGGKKKEKKNNPPREWLCKTSTPRGKTALTEGRKEKKKGEFIGCPCSKGRRCERKKREILIGPTSNVYGVVQEGGKKRRGEGSLSLRTLLRRGEKKEKGPKKKKKWTGSS